jgi:putative membrane protein
MKKGWVIAGIVLGVVALVVIGLLFAGGLVAAARGTYGPHMMVGRYGGLWGIGVGGGERLMVLGAALVLLLLFAAVVAGVVLVVIWLAGRKQKVSAAEPTPLDILKKRYAAGEIDREEFERMKEELK